MRKLSLVLTAVVMLAGCSSSNPVQKFFSNLTAAECDNQAATLGNLPLTFMTPNQAQELLAGFCAGAFGTSPAPAPAAGMGPALPGSASAPAAK